MINEAAYRKILSDLLPYKADLIAVSKLQDIDAIKELYHQGQRNFGENYVQELNEKQSLLPSDIHWHFIGHLQTNKVKFILPFISMIHGVDSLKLLNEINKQAGKFGKTAKVLLQVHIASEETKFGLSYAELEEMFRSGLTEKMNHLSIRGLMGMASNTEDNDLIRSEFRGLKKFYEKIIEEYPSACKNFRHLSMGMTADYQIALEEGSTMVRIGSAIFGERTPK